MVSLPPGFNATNAANIGAQVCVVSMIASLFFGWFVSVVDPSQPPSQHQVQCRRLGLLVPTKH